MRKAMVIHAHPCEESYSGALLAQTVEGLRAVHWDVDVCDLYAEGFQPVLTAEERRGYHDIPANAGVVDSYVERLCRARALVLVFPVWNFGFPAILKGFFDRVFLPGVSFTIERGRVKPNLTNIRRLGAVTTYGGSRIRALGVGDPPRRVVTRAVAHVCQPMKTEYLALYDMNRASDAKRAAFLARVSRTMETF